MDNIDDINWEEIYTGLRGRLIIKFMNLYHKGLHRLITEEISCRKNSTILDIGCGGGGLIKFLSMKTSGKVTGIDYSANMVNAAIKKNAKGIKKGQISIIRASVSELPFDKNSFDTITAFETIHFWPSIPDDLIEIKRVLKPGGSLHIMNKVPDEKSKWYDFVKFKNPDECRDTLSTAGYVNIEISTKLKKSWMYATGIKPS
ncbi:MAG: class I SAM-dependent methyltransferase [Clostridia bacterium]|nr:class I SAM-dependent methyltransferase [Clostridia bacterium]